MSSHTYTSALSLILTVSDAQERRFSAGTHCDINLVLGNNGTNKDSPQKQQSQHDWVLPKLTSEFVADDKQLDLIVSEPENGTTTYSC